MKLFKTKTGKVWHIVDFDGDPTGHEYYGWRGAERYTAGLCGFGYQVGGTYNDGPGPETKDFNEGDTCNMCKPCIIAAWDKGLLKLVEHKVEPDGKECE